MRKKAMPVAILLAISVITMGMVIGASSDAKAPTTAMTNSHAEQSTSVSETSQPRVTAAPVVLTTLLTPNASGNFRHPGVAEDSKGNRLVIFRSNEGTKYLYTYCVKGGMWSSPTYIGEGIQPTLISSLYSYIDVDSSDRFHCHWENANAMVYASFKDGVWTTPAKISTRGRYDLTSALAVSSTDEVVAIDCEVTGWDKEIYLHRKGKNDATFGTPFNISRDGQVASTQPCLAIDSQDHVWAVWKSDFIYGHLEENLVIYLAQFGLNNEDIDDWIMVSPDPGWSFLPQVAVNNEDKVMTLFSTSTWGDYNSRLYDQNTKTLSPMVPLKIGLSMSPWHTFFSRMVAHGKDFYAAVMNPARTIFLMKFNETAARWDVVTQVSDRGAEIFALYSGYDNMLIAWNANEDPSNVFITTVSVDPYSKIRVRSVSNLVVQRKEERGFFRSFILNALTWGTNPDNTAKGVTVTAHHVYRKARTEDNTKWTRLVELAGTVFSYDDRNVPASSDYIYAVTCVDDKGNESAIY
jgi:hypothetical protein